MTSESSGNVAASGGRSPLSTVDRETSPDPSLAGGCGHCCAYLAFRLEEPRAIDASDRVEYAAHLIVRHGFVR